MLSLIMVIPQVAQVEDNTEDSKATFSSLTGKKLIQFGWDMAYPDYVRDNIRDIEKHPFEGIIFRLPSGGGSLFDIGNWDKNERAIRDQEKVLAQIKWNKFSDNFLNVNAATAEMDWYDDAQWKKILSHARFCARAARLARCVGLAFDPEPYGTLNPWNYSQQKYSATRSYAEYSQQAHERGRQFMRAMSGEFPDLKLLMFFQYSEFYEASHHPDPTVRMAALKNFDTWNLMLPFLNGMLEESGKNVQLIDGNEPAYWYQKSNEYYQAYWRIRQGAKINVPAYLKPKFDSNVRAASALFIDDVFGMREEVIGYKIASGMTPEERARWFEHNVYYALKTSDEYAWIWGERINWWKNENFPSGILEAITSAKQKLRDGKELGYDLDQTFKSAQLRLSQMLREKLIRRKAAIPRLDGLPAPATDGRLEENVYREIPWLEPFISLISPKERQETLASTRAWLAYDEQNLYITFRCDEPEMAKQKVKIAERDGQIWEGESIEVSILKPGQATDIPAEEYYHFILNPANVQWDSIDTVRESSLAFDAQWRSATTRDEKGWSAEIALPWKEIGVTNVKKGLTLQGNLARMRVAAASELSSWSQFIGGFQEPENFGTWVLD